MNCPLDIWEATDALGALVHPSPRKNVERPQVVTRPLIQLHPDRWPVCPLCKQSVLDHDCDDKATFDALIDERIGK